MSATEIGQIGGALLLTYYGGQGHRPKWIGWGMVLFGASAALCSLPHFIFGWTEPNTVGSSVMSGHNPSPAAANQSHLIVTKQIDMTCRQVNYSSPSYLNRTGIDERNQQCAGNLLYLNTKLPFNQHSSFFSPFSGSSEQQAISQITTVVLSIFFLSLLGIGMGRTAVETLGIPYMDDNVANRESPTYFG